MPTSFSSSPRRNPGTPLDLGLIDSIHIDEAAAHRHSEAIRGGVVLDRDGEVDRLIRAITLIDLTTLEGSDTPDTVRRLCARARQPLNPELASSLGLDATSIRTAAVCVYHAFIPTALDALHGSGIPVAAVSAGFPAGLSPLEQRVAEIRASVGAGALEIDAVIARYHVLTGDWQSLYDEIRAFREAAGDAHLKVILSAGELGPLVNVARAATVTMMAGADFIKTSTGKEAVNATPPIGLAMMRALREYRDSTDLEVGFKAAGGIRTPVDALNWMFMVEEELGPAWLRPERFRFGASSLLKAIEQRLEELATSTRSAG